MRKHWKRFLVMFGLSWLTAAATVTLSLGRYAAEDFSLPDLTPIYLLLAVFGLPMTAIVALPSMLFLRRKSRLILCAPHFNAAELTLSSTRRPPAHAPRRSGRFAVGEAQGSAGAS